LNCLEAGAVVALWPCAAHGAVAVHARTGGASARTPSATGLRYNTVFLARRLSPSSSRRPKPAPSPLAQPPRSWGGTPARWRLARLAHRHSAAPKVVRAVRYARERHVQRPGAVLGPAEYFSCQSADRERSLDPSTPSGGSSLGSSDRLQMEEIREISEICKTGIRQLLGSPYDSSRKSC
jgi:hypothetical protein